MKSWILILTIILSVGGLSVNAQNHVDDSKKLEYQFVITGDSGTFKNGKLYLKGTPIVSFYYLGEVRKDGHFLVGSFTEMWEKNAATYKADPPSGTMSVLNQEGSLGAVVQVANPVSTLNSITFDAKVLEGELPDSFNASSFFLKLNVKEKLQTQN